MNAVFAKRWVHAVAVIRPHPRQSGLMLRAMRSILGIPALLSGPPAPLMATDSGARLQCEMPHPTSDEAVADAHPSSMLA
jgi:hypothetical protein